MKPVGFLVSFFALQGYCETALCFISGPDENIPSAFRSRRAPSAGRILSAAQSNRVRWPILRQGCGIGAT